MNSHPRLTPWKSSDEVVYLKGLFFPADREHISRDELHRQYEEAISLVEMYSSRTRVSHILQSTSHLFSALMMLESFEGGLDDTVRLTASMTIIRFVNGLLDPNQQSQFAIPLHLLAKKIGLPSLFVEFRHSATHDALPSLEMCKTCVDRAIDWVWDHYWDGVLSIVEPQVETDDLEESLIKELKDLFKQYRRIRRQNITKLYKFGDSTPEGKEYWTCIAGIKDHADMANFYNVMIERIVSNKLKWEHLRALFEPMMNHFIHLKGWDFPLGLIDSMLSKNYEYSKFRGIDDTERAYLNDQEFKCAQKWIRWLAIEQIDRYDDVLISKMIDTLGKTNHELNVELLEKLQSRFSADPVIKDKIQAKLTLIQRLSTDTKTKRMNNLEDIMSDLESLKKRAKVTPTLHIKSFESHPNWTPKPFGVI